MSEEVLSDAGLASSVRVIDLETEAVNDERVVPFANVASDVGFASSVRVFEWEPEAVNEVEVEVVVSAGVASDAGLVSVEPEAVNAVEVVDLDLDVRPTKFLSANVCTLRPSDEVTGVSSARRLDLERQFEKAGVSFAGLQETRGRQELDVQNKYFRMLGAPVLKGRGGV